MRLAQLQLPSLPTSAFRIRERAEREGWVSRPAHHRGGGLEYAVTSLPAAAQLAIAQRQTSSLTQLADSPARFGAPRASSAQLSLGEIPLSSSDSSGAGLISPSTGALTSLPVAASIDGPAAQPATPRPSPAAAFTRGPSIDPVAAAKAAILARLREYQRHSDLIAEQSLAAFVAAYNARALDVPEARDLIAHISVPSLLRWRRRFARDGLAGLADKYGNRRGSGLLDNNDQWRDIALAMLAQSGHHLRLKRIHEAIIARCAASGAGASNNTPSLGAIRRFVVKWRREHPSLDLAMHNPDRWKGKYRVKIAKADEDIVRLNQEWQIDGTPGDILLTDGRHHILALIDVYSRRMMFHVAPSEGTQAAIRLLSRAMLKWGVPELVHGDNGKGFISHWSLRFLEDLIGPNPYKASRPFTPEDKPFIESGIGVMSHELLPLLPGFSGHSVAQRQELRARKSFAARFGAPLKQTFEVEIDGAGLQSRLDRWSDHLYANRPHSGLAGKSPNQVAAEWTGEVRKIGDERALAMLAEEAVARQLSREGVRFAGARFVPTVDGLDNYVAHIGETGLVFPDPSGDIGRAFLFIDAPTGREPICTLENVDRLGMNRSDLAILARQAQNKFLREGRAELRRIKHRIKPETIADAILDHAVATSPFLAPQAEEIAHTTAALAAASDADTSFLISRQPRAARHDPAELAEADAMFDAAFAGAARAGGAMSAAAESAEQGADDEDRRWNRYCRLRDLTDSAISDSDRFWMRSYETTPEYRVAIEMEALAVRKTAAA